MKQQEPLTNLAINALLFTMLASLGTLLDLLPRMVLMIKTSTTRILIHLALQIAAQLPGLIFGVVGIRFLVWTEASTWVPLGMILVPIVMLNASVVGLLACYYGLRWNILGIPIPRSVFKEQSEVKLPAGQTFSAFRWLKAVRAARQRELLPHTLKGIQPALLGLALRPVAFVILLDLASRDHPSVAQVLPLSLPAAILGWACWLPWMPVLRALRLHKHNQGRPQGLVERLENRSIVVLSVATIALFAKVITMNRSHDQILSGVGAGLGASFLFGLLEVHVFQRKWKNWTPPAP